MSPFRNGVFLSVGTKYVSIDSIEHVDGERELKNPILISKSLSDKDNSVSS